MGKTARSRKTYGYGNRRAHQRPRQERDVYLMLMNDEQDGSGPVEDKALADSLGIAMGVGPSQDSGGLGVWRVPEPVEKAARDRLRDPDADYRTAQEIRNDEAAALASEAVPGEPHPDYREAHERR